MKNTVSKSLPLWLLELLKFQNETKHHYPNQYAPSKGYLDWENQPSPFRTFTGDDKSEKYLLYLNRKMMMMTTNSTTTTTTTQSHIATDQVVDHPRNNEFNNFYFLEEQIATRADDNGGTILRHHQKQPQQQQLLLHELNAKTMSQFLFYSASLSATKQYKHDRWSLRVNPSSGNLHPCELYLILPTNPIESLIEKQQTNSNSTSNPTNGGGTYVYSYQPEDHSLQLRCEFPNFHFLLENLNQNCNNCNNNNRFFFVCINTINYRETWKYGIRSYRYSQLDTGHLLHCLKQSANLFGWDCLLLNEHLSINSNNNNELMEYMLGLDQFDELFEHDRERERFESIILIDTKPNITIRNSNSNSNIGSSIGMDSKELIVKELNVDSSGIKFQNYETIIKDTELNKSTNTTTPLKHLKLKLINNSDNSNNSNSNDVIIDLGGNRKRFGTPNLLIKSGAKHQEWPQLEPIPQLCSKQSPSKQQSHSLLIGDSFQQQLKTQFKFNPPIQFLHQDQHSQQHSLLAAHEIIRTRRSAQNFNATTSIMTSMDWFSMLEKMLPDRYPSLWRCLSPFNTNSTTTNNTTTNSDSSDSSDSISEFIMGRNVNLLLFVHRIDGLESGMYFLHRSSPSLSANSDKEECDEELKKLKLISNSNFEWTKVETISNLPLYRLFSGDCRKFSKLSSCVQDIASDGCFSVSMIVNDRFLKMQQPQHYKWLYWEAGFMGQLLYLEAERLGLRGTGIGCFFDDSVLNSFLSSPIGGSGDEMNDEDGNGGGGMGGGSGDYQDLYHFTVGTAVEDLRIQNVPCYPLSRLSDDDNNE